MLEKLIEYLKNLPEEEQKKLADAIARSEQTEDIKPLEPQTQQVEESTEQTQEQTESETTEQIEEQDGQAQEETTDTAQVEEQGEQTVQEGTAGEATPPVEESTEQDRQESTTEEEDGIPPLQRILPPDEAEEQAVEGQQDLSEVQAKEDEKQAVIDGLNAKVKALEEELQFYKDKVDGAFGYESKTNTPVKVNALYDNCDGLKLKRI